MKCVRLFILLVGAVLFGAPSAFALSGTVALPFAATYAAPDGSVCTHRGIDLSMSSGEAVSSPVDGLVAFAGRVPGPHGGSVLAVTIETADAKVTLLPLAGLAVERGARVSLGESLGTCAGSGDPSSRAPHIHVSERRGDVYVDPVGLLEAPTATAEAEGAETCAQRAESNEPAAEPVATPMPVPTPVPNALDVPALSAARQPHSVTLRPNTGQVAHGTDRARSGAVGASALAAGSALGTRGAGGTASGEIAPGVSLAPSAPAKAAVPGPGPVPQVSPVGSALGVAANASEPVLRFASGHLPASIGVAAAALLAAIGLITRRALTRRFVGGGRVSDRLGTVLQHLHAGDTLCRLTSCPGPLPSQSRGH